MKQKFQFILLIIILITFKVTTHAQWRPTNGPGGGAVNDIQKFGNRLFIGTGEADAESIFAGGVFTSDDMGQTWILRHQGFQNCRVTSLLQHNGNIYAGTTSGIFISADNGNTWAVSNTGLANKRVKCLAVKDNIVFAGMDGSGLHKSSDGGLTWTNVFNFTSVNKIFVDGNYLYAMGPGDGAYRRSSDNGNTWITYGSANGVLGSSSIAMVRRGGDLFLCTYEQGLYKSSNEGENWTALQGDPTGPTYLGLFGDTLWCANITGQLQYSTDGAATWTIWPEVLQTASPVALWKSGGLMLVGSAKGLFRINGNNPSEMIAGMANGNIRQLTHNQNRIFAGTNTGVFYTDDEGQTWTRAYFNQQDGVYSVLNYQGVILAGTLALGTMKSDDNGANWIRTGFSLPIGRVNGLLQTGSKVLATVSLNGLYKSLDTGKTWTKITAFPTSSTISISKIPAASGVGDVIFIGGSNNRTYRSTDEGETWTECILENNTAGGASSKGLFGVVRKGNILFGNSIYHLYSSSDEGLNWNIIPFPPFTVTNCALMTDSNQIFIAAGANKICRSFDGGLTWAIDTIRLSELNGSTYTAMPITGRLSGIYTIGEKKYLTTEGLGVWREGFIPNQVSNEKAGLQPRFLRIFPNPSVGKVTFLQEKELPAGSELSLYNSAGRRLCTIGILDNGNKPAFEWNAEQLPRGLYHYSLRGKDVSESGRIVLE